MDTIRLAIAGATGRMGRAVLQRMAHDERFVLAAALTEPGDPLAGTAARVGEMDVDLTASLDGSCAALIDFTTGGGTMAWLEVCASQHIALVIGATGHDDRTMERMREAAKVIPIVFAPNCSVGVQAIRNVLSQFARELGEAYDVEIVEAHHRNKTDAPSGTAMALAEDVASATGRRLDRDAVFGRHGQVGGRPGAQIGIHALRMGDIVSHHEIHFSGPGETVTICHRADTRDTFAAGALRAAAWVVERAPGMYGMGDVLS